MTTALSPVTPALRAAAREPAVVNWNLITVALVYVVWSWVHLPSSIWARCALACYLIWRMQPDVVLPYLLSEVQLRLNVAGGLADADTFGGGIAEVQRSLTGYEQYAFTLPCVLYAVRTFVAATSAHAPRRATFPFRLYGLYLVGMLFVISGALMASGTGGWTAGIRCYCLVSLYFYGLLMPAVSHRQVERLAIGFGVFYVVIAVATLLNGFHSRQFWILLPLAGSCVPLLLFRGASLGRLVGASVLSGLGLVVSLEATFTVLLQWVWNALAGTCLGVVRAPSSRATMATALTLSAFVFSVVLLLYGAFAHDPTRDAMETSHSGTLIDRANYKLTGDRGPIWWGAMREIALHPTLCGTPTWTFLITSHGKEAEWAFSTHNIVLDPLLRLGVVAGPVLLLVLLHAAWGCRNAITRDGSTGVTMLALAVISNIVLGGATLPYMLNDREAEHMMMTAGLVGAYGVRRSWSRGRVTSRPPDLQRGLRSLPAA